jgi:hypothetical protein
LESKEGRDAYGDGVDEIKDVIYAPKNKKHIQTIMQSIVSNQDPNKPEIYG